MFEHISVNLDLRSQNTPVVDLPFPSYTQRLTCEPSLQSTRLEPFLLLHTYQTMFHQCNFTINSSITHVLADNVPKGYYSLDVYMDFVSDDRGDMKYYRSVMLVKILVISDLQTKASSVFEKSVSNDCEASSI